MDIFADFSGLQLNRAKSSFVGFGLATVEIWRCAEILATPIETLPIRYLGLPLTDRRLRTQNWQPVVEKVEKVEKRLGGWRGRLLSRGGRLVLVKAVLSAIPTYFMSAFRMPAGVWRRLKSVMRSFFWRGADLGRGGALVAWSSVCRPFADGGLGIHHLQHANSALLCKWVARVMQPSEDLISHLLREVYSSSLDWDEWATPRRGDSPVIAGLRGIFRWFDLSSVPSWGAGLISDFGRTTGLGKGGWLMPSLVSTAWPQLRTSRSDLHGLAPGTRRYPRLFRTSD